MALLVILAFLLQSQLTLGQIPGMEVDDNFDFDSWNPDPTGGMAFMSGSKYFGFFLFCYIFGSYGQR